jgi:alpha-glucosidase
MTSPRPWWQTGIVYQVYPRSFQDSTGDGVGDLSGILRRLDYLHSIHMDVLWLSPIYASPMRDFGYDISDFCAVDPLFGTPADFDRLLAETHARGMKLILDYVPNHTSDEHPWFAESRSSRNNPRRDWYIWRDPAPDGGPPNNWVSVFGGPAWTLDEATGQYYMHQFAPYQPELDLRNPAVLEAMLDVARFWLDKGVDGFRLDAIHMLVEDAELRDEPRNEGWDGVHPHDELRHLYTQDQPETHDFIRTLRALVDSYATPEGGRVLLGELYLPLERVMDYYGAQLDECHLPLNLNLTYTPWDAGQIRKLVDEYEGLLPPGAWPNWVLGNHDQHRVATRIGRENARAANLLLLTLRGTPICYYGDEIAMRDVPIPVEEMQDPQALGKPESADKVGRDPERTPMQWDASPNAGFAAEGVDPWLPVSSNYRLTNVAAQEQEPASMLAFFRALAALRRASPALQAGDYAPLDAGADDVLAYLRRCEGERMAVAINFGGEARTLDLSAAGGRGALALSTAMHRAGDVDLAALTLAGAEGIVIRIEG